MVYESVFFGLAWLVQTHFAQCRGNIIFDGFPYPRGLPRQYVPFSVVRSICVYWLYADRRISIVCILILYNRYNCYRITYYVICRKYFTHINCCRSSKSCKVRTRFDRQSFTVFPIFFIFHDLLQKRRLLFVLAISIFSKKRD